MKPDRERLIAVRERLSSETHWTKKATARDDTGVVCPINSVKATCWCLASACAIEGVSELFAKAHFREPIFADPVAEIIAFNDDPQTTHKDVLKALDRVIRNCKT